MGASALYSSTDTSAPVLVDGVGSLVNVLKKCLVTGYGAKPGLGWTQELVSPDGNVVVFRNKGTGLFLKVSNAINYAATGMAAKIEVFEAMRAWDVGYLRTPETGVDQYFAYANTKAGSRVCKWKVIGDDKGFWIITEFSTTALNYAAAYFGDYIPYHMENKFNWISFTHTSVEVTHYHFYCPYGYILNGYIRVPRSHQNQLPARSINLYSGAGRTLNTSDISYCYLGNYSWLNSTSWGVSPIPLFAKPLIAVSATTTPFISTYIGEVPGLLECASWTPSGNIVQKSANSAIHVFWVNVQAKIGIIVGEGFRP